MTKMTAVAPDANCPTPLWLKFLDRVTEKNSELISYLQRVYGYSLTGDTSEEALFFLYGLGANGKGVYLHTVTGIMGDYHTTAPMEAFTETDRSGHPTELAGLQGARCVTSIETEAGRYWSENRIKALTGRDKISARFMRQDFFEYTPQFKPTIAGNHKPRLHNVMEAISRRVNLIPFAVVIPADERDKHLEDKIKAEWPGILHWLIGGCLEWQRIGLKPPAIVTETTNEYLKDEDAITLWIEDCCEQDAGAFTLSQDLYRAYKLWILKRNEKPYSLRRFVQTLVEHGCSLGREKGERRGVNGLTLSADGVSLLKAAAAAEANAPM
jgi:putative DNA primase/helicase